MGSSNPNSDRGLVGRDHELAVLELMLAGLADGRAGAACVCGEPGIGKSALLAELLGRAAYYDYRTAAGRAAEFESDLPFAILVDALEPLLRERDASELGLSPGEVELLSTLFPVLRRGKSSSAAHEGDERLQLRRALRTLLGALAADGPLVLALDDLHWADAASLDLICSLLHRGFDAPVLLALAM